MAEYTAKVARRRRRPHLAAIQGRILRMAGYWGDLDENMVVRLDELRDEVEGLDGEMNEAVEYAEDCARERGDG